jgi:hypothetical protein
VASPHLFSALPEGVAVLVPVNTLL